MQNAPINMISALLAPEAGGLTGKAKPSATLAALSGGGDQFLGAGKGGVPAATIAMLPTELLAHLQAQILASQSGQGRQIPELTTRTDGASACPEPVGQAQDAPLFSTLLGCLLQFQTPTAAESSDTGGTPVLPAHGLAADALQPAMPVARQASADAEETGEDPSWPLPAQMVVAAAMSYAPASPPPLPLCSTGVSPVACALPDTGGTPVLPQSMPGLPGALSAQPAPQGTPSPTAPAPAAAPALVAGDNPQPALSVPAVVPTAQDSWALEAGQPAKVTAEARSATPAGSGSPGPLGLEIFSPFAPLPTAKIGVNEPTVAPVPAARPGVEGVQDLQQPTQSPPDPDRPQQRPAEHAPGRAVAVGPAGAGDDGTYDLAQAVGLSRPIHPVLAPTATDQPKPAPGELRQQPAHVPTAVGVPAAVQSDAGQAAAPAVASAGPDSPEQPATDTAGRQVIQQVADYLRTHRSDAGHQIYLRLDPPHLGAVRIFLQADGHSLHGRLALDNPAAFQAVQREMPVLLRRLEESGVQLGQVDVVLSDSAQSGMERQTGMNWHLFDGGTGQQGAQRWQDQAPNFAGAESDGPSVGTAAAPASYVSDSAVNIWI